mgnify:FL=1
MVTLREILNLKQESASFIKLLNWMRLSPRMVLRVPIIMCFILSFRRERESLASDRPINNCILFRNPMVQMCSWLILKRKMGIFLILRRFAVWQHRKQKWSAHWFLYVLWRNVQADRCFCHARGLFWTVAQHEDWICLWCRNPESWSMCGQRIY